MEEKKERKFAQGMILKSPHEKAPDFVKLNIAINVDEFVEFLKFNRYKGWVNLDVKLSQKGTYYAELNDWAKNKDEEKAPENTDMPPF